MHTPLTLRTVKYHIKTKSYSLLVRTPREESRYLVWKTMNKQQINMMNHQIEIKKNDFPYNTERNLKHYILWYHRTQEHFDYKKGLAFALKPISNWQLKSRWQKSEVINIPTIQTPLPNCSAFISTRHNEHCKLR